VDVNTLVFGSMAVLSLAIFSILVGLKPLRSRQSKM